MVFTSALRTTGEPPKCEYLPTTVPDGADPDAVPDGHNLDTYWDLLDAEFKSRSNEMLTMFKTVKAEFYAVKGVDNQSLL